MSTLRVLLVALLFLAAHDTFAIDVCRTFSFKGFERQMRLAESVIGSSVTTNRNEMKVYVTVVEGQLYVQTNYLAPGAEAPAKLAIDNKAPLATIVWNLITDDPSNVPFQEAETALRNQITFYVDRFRLSQSQFAELDFTGAKKVVDNQNSILNSGTPLTSSPLSSAAAPAQAVFAASQSASLPASAAEPVPKTISEAAILVLWSSPTGRWVLVIVAGLIAAVGLLVALPEAVKHSILRRLGMLPTSPDSGSDAVKTDARRRR